MKICNTCGKEKSLEDFTNNKRNKDGKDRRCKECQSIKNKENREKLRESQRKWREKNPDYYKNYDKKPEMIDYRKQYYEKNSQVYKDRMKQWTKDNPEREAEIRKNYWENNRDKMNEYARKWKEQKRLEDVQYKLKENISRRLRYELNTLLNGQKTKKTLEYLGCSMEELKEYLEKKFKDGMTWDNYGEIWHIDHVIPCKAWNLELEEDNLFCWNFRNLQPLSSSENQSKRDKYSEKDKKAYILSLKNLNLF